MIKNWTKKFKLKPLIWFMLIELLLFTVIVPYGIKMLVFVNILLINAIFFAFLIFLPVIPYFCGKYIAKILKKVEYIDDSEFQKNKKYYREILDINSPLVLGYLDNFFIDKKKLIAEILYLINRGVIEIREGNLKITDNPQKIKLNSSEIIVLNRIENGKIKIDNIINFYEYIQECVKYEAKKLKLIKAKRELTSGFWKELKEKIGNIILFSGPVVIVLVYFFNFVIFSEKIIIFIVYVWAIVWYIGFLFVFTLPIIRDSFARERGKAIKRTSNGKELNQKLEGLKNYLKDYSMLDEREAKEIELWEDYLVYSVMFGHNKKIIEEYEKYN